MAGVAGWLVQHRIPRIALMAVLFPLPLLGVVTAAAAVLVTQVQGWRVALFDCAGALLLLVAITTLAGGESLAIGLGAALSWLVAVVLGALRPRGGLTLPVQLLVLLGVASVAIFEAVVDDAQSYWAGVLAGFAARAAAAGMDLGPTQVLLGLAGLMTGIVAASAVLSTVAALALGSRWADGLGRGDVGHEFRALRMGVVIAVMALLSAVLWLAGLRTTMDDFGLVFGAGFALQGLATVHWHAAERGWPRWWALALYGPMLVFPGLAAGGSLILAGIGVVDNIWSLRRRPGDVV